MNKPIESPPTTPVSQSPFNVVQSEEIDVVSPFDHNRKEHKAKTEDCSVCHTRETNKPEPVLPGHPACFDCHLKDLSSVDSKMCIVCHKTPVTRESVKEFPVRFDQFGLKRFSHRDHDDPEKMKGQMDPDKLSQRCEFCHRFDEQGLKASMPKHPECYACHAHQPNNQFASCGACHTGKPNAMQYASTLGTAFSLYNFRHGPHLKTAKCDRCHKTVDVPAGQPRTDILEINTARGQRHHSTCWTCHVQAKEPVCSRCHVSGRPF